MRLFRRNVLGVYAVYAAAIVSGLVVTPILLDSIGDASFGIWSFIGAITIYLSVLDFGVGPTIVRYAAEARGRRAPEDTNALASAGLALYGVIGLVTLPVGLVVAWLVPVLVDTPDDLVWEARVATFLVVLSIAARFPLGLFNNLLVGQQRFDLQNLANFISTVLYAVLVVVLMPNGGGLILLGALTLGTTLLRLVLPLRWLRRELPDLRLSRAFVTRERVRELVAFSGSNFLIHVANKVVFATDIVVVGIVLGAEAAALYAIPAKLFSLAFGLGSVGTGLLYPAFAEHEGAGEEERQRRLLLAGLRGGTAAAVMLALPLLFIPDLLIEGWVGEGYGESAPVLALLALVLLVHQPLYLVTQFLIARARQREIARALVAAGAANVVLSVVLAKTVGIWGVALSTLMTDLAVLALRRAGAARAGGLARRRRVRARCASGPSCPRSQSAVVLFVGVARWAEPDTLLELLPLGIAWALACGWRSGASASTPRSGPGIGRQLRPAAAPVPGPRLAPGSQRSRISPSYRRREHVPVELRAGPPRGRGDARRAPPRPRPSRTTASTNSRGVGTSTPAPVSRRFSVTL